MKQLYFFYQKMMFYVAQSYSEYSKPLVFLEKSALLALYLQSKGITITIFHLTLFNILMLCIAAVMGKILTVSGITAYNSGLGNKYNPQITEIIERLERIENKQNEKTPVSQVLGSAPKI